MTDDDVPQHIIDLGYKVVELDNEGRYQEAIIIAEQAYNLARQYFGSGHEEVVTTLNNLGHIYEALGDYHKAEEAYKDALAMARALPDREVLGFIGLLSNLAYLYHMMGDYAAAEPLYREAMDSCESNSVAKESALFAQILNNLGMLYLALDSYQTAEPLLRRALRMRVALKGEMHPAVAGSLINLAELYRKLDDFAQSKELLQYALIIQHATLNKNHPDMANTLNNLALAHRALGEYEAALAFYESALAIWYSVLGVQHPTIASTLNNLALLHKSMGDYSQAETLLQESLQMRRNVLGKDHPDLAGSLYNLADIHIVMGRVAEAFENTQEAARLDDQLLGQVFLIGSESQRMAHLVTVQVRTAGTLSLLLTYLRDKPDARQLGLNLVLRRKALAFEALVIQRDAILGGRYPALWDKLQEWIALRIQIAQATLNIPQTVNLEAYQQKLAEQSMRREQLETELASKIPEMNLARQLQAANCIQVAQAMPEGAVLIEFVHLDVFNFQKALAPNERRWLNARYVAFVLPAGRPDNVELVDLGEAKIIDMMIASFVKTMTGAGRQLAVGIEPVDSFFRVTSEGAMLREIIFDPITKYLNGNKRLYLVPDGELSHLPFEVLPTGGGQCLIDSYHISYLGSGRDLLRLKIEPIRSESSPALVIADPDFDLKQSAPSVSELPFFMSSGDLSNHDKSPIMPSMQQSRASRSRDYQPGSLRFRRLEGTRIEGERIAELLKVTPWLGQEALEGRVKTFCSPVAVHKEEFVGSGEFSSWRVEDYHSPRILHIATHGFFLADQFRGVIQDDAVSDSALGQDMQEKSRLERLVERRIENPLLRSGLVLAGINAWNWGEEVLTEAEDGLLTAEDVAALDLLDTELVVLSACQTGVGEVYRGEGVFGLRRAFLLAGAKTLVMSLWKVPDRQTQELMVHFYGFLQQGFEISIALHEAQKQIKQQPGQSHPFYWGAFICQGDSGPL